MSAEVAVIADRHQVAVAPPEMAAPFRLVEWAQEANAAHDLAVALCATSFCPQAFQNKPGEATAAILAGSEVGLSPIAALNAYDVIQGRPAPRAITLRALVQSAGHIVWLESATDKRVVMHGRRRGESEVQTSDWTWARAQGLGLTNKDGWKKQPQAMLIARATSEICRLVGADVILGIPYSAEELGDLEPEPTTTVTRATPARTTRAKRATAPEPVEPSFDDDSSDDDAGEAVESLAAPSEASPSEGITAAQMKKVAAQMRDLGITDRDDALGYVAEVIGRNLTSRNELTKDEAHALIEHMGRALGEISEEES